MDIKEKVVKVVVEQLGVKESEVKPSAELEKLLTSQAKSTP